MSVFSWFGQMLSSLQQAADMSELNSSQEEPADRCQIYVDSLDELMDQYDKLKAKIDWNLDQLFACRKSAATAVSELNVNTTQQSLNGAKLLMTTAANRVRQVRDEIEIVTRQDAADGN